MRTAADFDTFYAVPDPWRLSRASFRDRVLRRHLAPVANRCAVLELGCGEGHLTEHVFDVAGHVHGIDLSAVAVNRAKARGLRNAKFETADFLQIPFEGYDVITAVECIYYLLPDEREAFFAKVAREHCGILVLSAPITGNRYFTHAELLDTFERHNLALIDWHNITPRPLRAARVVGPILGWLPERFVFQRLYVVRVR